MIMLACDRLLLLWLYDIARKWLSSLVRSVQHGFVTVAFADNVFS